MDSTLLTSSTFLPFHNPNPNPLLPSNPLSLPSKPLLNPTSKSPFSAKSSTNRTLNPTIKQINEYPFAQTLKNTAKTALLTLAAALVAAKFHDLPARAETLSPPVEESSLKEEEFDEFSRDDNGSDAKSPLSKLMESNSEFVENLRSLLHKKLESGEDEEGLKILRKLVEAQPSEMEWKFLLARLLSEMRKNEEARAVFEEILGVNPLSFEALFENALLMDRCGEGEAVISRLERALSVALDENKAKEARDVRLIIAQIQFLHKNVEEALRSYEELSKEDPKDFRPYFCKGMIYSLLDRNAEAKEEFAKYRELSPKKFEVDGYLRSPLSRMKLFETGPQG